MRQPYKCDKCGLHSEVPIHENCGVVQAVYLIQEDHDNLTSVCAFHVDNIVIFPPIFDDGAVNES